MPRPTHVACWNRGLSAKLASQASDLTLAEQKRLEMARALATGPQLLLLDEPMGGLNPKEVEDASALVQQIRTPASRWSWSST
jgi:branched-chain amino acid transport system ATP-binding protein